MTTETQDTRTTLDEFIGHNQIRMSIEHSDSNPSMTDSANMDHYKCILLAGRSRMTVYFSKGYGHNGALPTIPEVLDCLASDASGFENARSFEDWCADHGYDTDSRKAEKTFKTVKRQSERLHELLGDSAYNTLLWEMERL